VKKIFHYSRKMDRVYSHYRWADRYARRGHDEKSHAHIRRALHYYNTATRFGGGLSEMQERLIASYAKSKPADRLSFIRRLCGDNFYRFFYNKPHEHNRISEEQ
jgi:hypothetical protein